LFASEGKLYAIVDAQTDSAATTDFSVELMLDQGTDTDISNTVVAGNKAYFVGCADANGCEVFTADGTAATQLTNLPSDIAPQGLNVSNGSAYFLQWNEANKTEDLKKA
jgi:hypothetical protein